LITLPNLREPGAVSNQGGKVLSSWKLLRNEETS